jgi:hypothetical protein
MGLVVIFHLPDDLCVIKKMAETTANIDYKVEYGKALSTISERDLTIQALQLRLWQVNKMLFGSKHEKFIAS